ncbi:MAG: hypothetical protein AAF847_01035 [Bacteroidota bacterium]
MKKVKRTVLICAALFLAASNYLLTSENSIVSFAMGVCLALIFFLLADRINRYLINRKIKSIELNNGEQILLAEPSTSYKGNSGTMGKLFLTNKRLVFVQQSLFSSNSNTLQIERRHIKQVADYNRAGLPTGIGIQLKKGASYAFAVDDRVAWKEMLG